MCGIESGKDAPNERPQRRSRARFCGASSTGDDHQTNVTISAPTGKVVWSLECVRRVVGVGRSGDDDIRNAGGWMIGRVEVGSRYEREREGGIGHRYEQRTN